MNKQVNLHPYYAMIYWKIKALFEDDDEIESIELDDENKICTIATNTFDKFLMLKKYLKPKFQEGDDSLEINIKCKANYSIIDELKILFKGNPHFQCVYEQNIVSKDPSATSFKTIICEMQDEAIHYFSDDMFNPYLESTTLAEDLCRELFKPELIGFPIITHNDEHEFYNDKWDDEWDDDVDEYCYDDADEYCCDKKRELPF